MRLELTGRHIDITPGVRRIVEGKLARLTRLLNDSAVSAQAVLTREKNGARADVTLHARGEKFLHGIGRGSNVSVAVGQAIDKIVQQAQTVKGKWEARKRRGVKGLPPAEMAEGAPRRGRAALAGATAATAAPPTRRARVRMPPILKASRQTIRDMSISDAAGLIDGGEGAVVFRDAETSRIAVLYRAPGGDLTLIETEA
ncbi:MAG: ribosome-associated translation inhibitor RaiA [Vicinamibacterales bacterium]